MEQIQTILSSSIFGRWLIGISHWFGVQWQGSLAVSAFLSPSQALGEKASQSSLCYRLFQWVRSLLSTIYEKLRLDVLFEGSLLRQSTIWCCLLGGLVAIVPTMMALAMALVSMVSLAITMIRQRSYPLAYSPTNRFLLIYVATYAFAVTVSISPSDSIYPGLLTVVFILTAILLQNVLVSRRQLTLFTGILVLGATVVAIVGIAQYMLGVTGAASWVDSDMFDSITTRVYGTLQNPNMLAQYLLLALPFTVPLFFSASIKTEKLLWLGCAGTIVLALIFTFSRGGWLGGLIAAGVFVLLLQPQLLLLAPVVLLVLFVALPDTIIDRFTSIGDMSDSSTSYRVSIWMGSIAMLQDYWFCGVGPGTAVFNQLYPFYSFSAASSQHAHNLFLQLMVDGGVCVLGIFLIVIISFCRHLCVALSKTHTLALRCYLIAPIAAMAGFLAQGMTDYSFYNHRVALAFWIIVGLGLAWGNFAKKEATTP